MKFQIAILNNYKRLLIVLSLSFLVLFNNNVYAQSKDFLYEVKEGETFASIAAKYKLSPEKLADYNNLDYYEGQLLSKKLRIPHVVIETESKKNIEKKIPETVEVAEKKDTLKAAKIVAPVAIKSVPEPTVTTVEPTVTTVESKGSKESKNIIDQPESKIAEEKSEANTKKINLKGFSKLPPIKDMVPFLIFLGVSFLLLIGGIFLYRYNQR